MHPNPLEIKPGRIFILRCVRKSEHSILTALERLGLVSSRLVSREYIFRPAENLTRRLREMGLTSG